MTATVEVSLLEQHPLSAAFPSMPENEIAALALDIEAHGQREPGITLDGMVLDGWHRYLACHRLGVQFKAKEYDGYDPLAFVISHNLHRRHLTATQRANAVVAANNWHPPGQLPKGAPGAPFTMKTIGEMANSAEVSERTIQQVKKAQEVAPELGDAMKAGTLSAKQAAAVADLTPAKRAKAVKAIKEGKPPAPKKEKLPEDAKARAELTDLRGKYADLLEKHTDLADTARALEDKLTMFETTDPDEQQKEIAKLQKRIARLDGEVQRLTVARNDCQNKNNGLIREVKRLKRKAGE